MGIIDRIRGAKKQHDTHGQPLATGLRSKAVADRQVDELLGIVKGVISDGVVTQDEVSFMLAWLESNRQSSQLWPAKVIYPRLYRVLADDGYLDEDEAKEMFDLLSQVVGGAEIVEGEQSLSTTMPYTQPPPKIIFPDKEFCFTGKFFSGTRRWCQNEIKGRGGISIRDIRKSLDYLVIGEIGSRDWVHSTFGRKIEAAVEYVEGGASIAIVGEEHWVEALRG